MLAPLDYGRSFILGKATWNEVRFWVESRTRIIDDRTGRHEDYLQCGACKSEDTFGKKGLFLKDNYDFIPIFGPKYGIIFRRHAYPNADYKSVQLATGMWDGQTNHLLGTPGYAELTTNDAILHATRAYLPLVAQTEIWNDETKLRAIIEYPVKTINTHRERNMHQVDTGPVAFPDLSKGGKRHVDAISLAFVAFNVPTFADFLLEAPTPVREQGFKGKELCKIYHFAKRLSLKAKNRLIAIHG